jgi:hypothetical protein
MVKQRAPRKEQLNNTLIARAKAGGKHKNSKSKRTLKAKLVKELQTELDKD